MKKTAMLFAALLALLAVMSACAPATTAPATTAPVTPTNTPDSVTPEPSVTPDPEQLNSQVQAMMPILDSVVLSMGDDGYDGTDAQFLWTALYLTSVNWPSAHPMIDQTDTATLLVPKAVMQAFASAISADYEALPELPADFTAVQYDEALDAYRLERSDRGTSRTALDAVSQLEDGTINATIHLLGEPDEFFGAYTLTLVPNEDTASVDAGFIYSIVNVTRVDS